MQSIEIAELRQQVDPEGKYVEFSTLRSAVPLSKLVDRLELKVSAPSEGGEVRAECPLCRKEKGLAIDLEEGKFNCFNKPCALKGSGSIDFFARVYDLSAKEAAHLLALIFEIEPYTRSEEKTKKGKPARSTAKKASGGGGKSEEPGDRVSREEFDKLSRRLNRLSQIVFSYMLDGDQNGSQPGG